MVIVQQKLIKLNELLQNFKSDSKLQTNSKNWVLPLLL